MKQNIDTSLIEDDEQTVKAVNDITKSDSDSLLDIHRSSAQVIVHRGIVKRMLDVFKKPLFIKSLLASIGVLLVVIFIVPEMRRQTLNLFGVRAGFEVQIVDDATSQPLKEVTVMIDSMQAQTDDKGTATFKGLRLGEAKVHIEKRGFRAESFVVNIGVGSNKQAKKGLTAIGETYNFSFVQFLSDTPISGVEVVSGIASALSDEHGVAKVVVPAEDITSDAPMSFIVKKDGFREETIMLTKDQKNDNSNQLVPDKKRVFTTKRDGTIDIYTSYIDGKEEKLLLRGSGIERDDVALLAPESGSQVAFVASRENIKDQYGYLLNTLYFIDINSRVVTKVDQSSDIRLLGWGSSDTLIYSTSSSGTSAGSPDRQKIISVSQLSPGSKKELARANGFYDMLLVRDMVYYSPFNYYDASTEKGVFRVSLDGSNRSKIYDKETYSLMRTGYTTIAFDSGGQWYGYDSRNPTAAPAVRIQPSQAASVRYVDDTEQGLAAWSEERDGLGIVFIQKDSNSEPEGIAKQATITGDIYWYNSQYIVYRNNTARSYYETVQSIKTHKSLDLTNIHPYLLAR